MYGNYAQICEQWLHNLSVHGHKKRLLQSKANKTLFLNTQYREREKREREWRENPQ